LQDIADQKGATLLTWEATPPDAAMNRASEMGLKSVVFSPLATRPSNGDFVLVMQTQIANMVK